MFSAFNKTFFLKFSKFNYLNFNKNLHLLSSPNLEIVQHPFSQEENINSIDCKGRNSKSPKRANHGARPCSSVMRQLKKRAYYRKDRTKW